MNNAKLRITTFLIIASSALLAACGGGGGGGSAGVPTAAPTGTPVSAGSGLKLSSSSLSFTSKAAQSLNASESGYTGAISVSGCGGIVTVTPANPSGPKATLSVTPVTAGACTLVVSDARGNSASVTVSATLTQGSIQ